MPSSDCLFSIKHLCQKLLKSNNAYLSYSKKCRGCFFETQCRCYQHGLGSVPAIVVWSGNMSIPLMCMLIDHFTVRAMLCAVYAMVVSACPSVCLSITSRCSTKMATHRNTQTTPHDSPGTLVSVSYTHLTLPTNREV